MEREVKRRSGGKAWNEMAENRTKRCDKVKGRNYTRRESVGGRIRDTMNSLMFNGKIMRERTKRDSSRKFLWTLVVQLAIQWMFSDGRMQTRARGCSWQLRLP